MSTIEQAAKRLEQLRRSGVEGIPSATGPGSEGSAAGTAAEPVPLRVVKELATRAPVPELGERPERLGMDRAQDGAPSASSPTTVAGAATGESVPVFAPASKIRFEIDLARLSVNGFITPQAPRSRLAEQFRVIKRPLLTNVQGKAAAPVLNANRIMVTSSLPAEGKTFVAVNLAMSLATEVDTHVLLVDADTSRPMVLERLGVKAEKGLLDLLLDPALTLDSVVMSTSVERLSVLPAGTPHEHATELLGSEAMSRLVERLASADPRLIVLFDTPPLLAASEARVLAAHMGQVVVVVAADDTPQRTLEEALATVENCPVVMTLLNRSTASESAQYYGYYGSHPG